MFEPHALAKVLPAMSGEDYERLRADIGANGLLEPITLYEGKLLDGVNRQKACSEAGVEPRYEEFSGDDPVGFVFSRNLARRHLTISQAGMAGANLTSLARKHGGDRKSQASKSRSDLTLTAEEAARAVGVSKGSVVNARRVIKDRPDLAKKVKAGKMSLNAAYEQTTGRPTGGHGPRRAKNWNGKTNPTREREIRAKKNGKPDNYNQLLRLSLDMNRACSIIESYRVDDFDLEATTLDLVDTFYDDLITLGQWVDRAMMATQVWLGDVKVRRKIDALRNTVGRTPEETENFRRVADKLERRLEAVLPSGV
jgi:hypothetical protein